MSSHGIVDVVVIGDGPAGSALAKGCVRRGLDTVLVGPDADWAATYSCWVDDITDLQESIGGNDTRQDRARPWFAHVSPTVDVWAARRHRVERSYGVLDNGTLRADLRNGVEHRTGHVELIEPGTRSHRVVLARAADLQARLVVDAAGWPSRFAPDAARTGRVAQPAWQTAVGVVLDAPPDGDLGSPTLMDFRAVRGGAGDDRVSSIGPAGVTSFAYALPVVDGWLVEETVLAARPAVEPVALIARLAARLGRHPDELLADASRREFVRIPMGVALPAADQPVVAFGAAGGYIHPATGYSVGASLRAVPRVVDGILEASHASGVMDSSIVWDAVWPTALRRTRVFHDFGLDTLMRLDGEGIRTFFDVFFGLPVEQWSSYLRIDASPADTAELMLALFRSSPWSLRRQLAVGNPMALARLIRP